jgi:ABC-2 type transport system ATP-binding protein
MTANAIIVEDIHKAYKNVTALNGVDLVAAQGKVLGLLGPNGAGKTTLVRILTTLLKADRGRASVAGVDVIKYPQRVRELIGLAGQYPAVDEKLTGRENLQMVGRLYHFSRADSRVRAGELLDLFNLTDAGDRPIKTYSGGMRRRLDLAASIVARPQVLFLDEPTTGLDPRTRQDLWRFIRELVADGTTLLLTTQYLEEADALADRITLIDGGRVVADGTSDELKSRFGTDVLELIFIHSADASRAAAVLTPLALDIPEVDFNAGKVTLAVSEGSQQLMQAVRLLDNAQIPVANLSLRRPSLDEVFLKLTGKPQGEPAGS